MSNIGGINYTITDTSQLLSVPIRLSVKELTVAVAATINGIYPEMPVPSME